MGAQCKQRKRCESKKVFQNLSEATLFISQQEKRRFTADRKGHRRPMRPYLCKVCSKIHVGHIPLDEWHEEKKARDSRRNLFGRVVSK